eukprot:bmy_08855T0
MASLAARARTRPRAPPRPAAAGAAAGTKAARVWAGRRAGSALGPAPPGASPPARARLRRAPAPRTAGLLVAGRRREGCKQCGRGAAPRGGAVPRVPAARARVLDGARRVERRLGLAAVSLPASRAAGAEHGGGSGSRARPGLAGPARGPRARAPEREAAEVRAGAGAGAAAAKAAERGAGPRRLQNLGQKLRSRRRHRRRHRRARAPPSPAERRDRGVKPRRALRRVQSAGATCSVSLRLGPSAVPGEPGRGRGRARCRGGVPGRLRRFPVPRAAIRTPAGAGAGAAVERPGCGAGARAGPCRPGKAWARVRGQVRGAAEAGAEECDASPAWC